MVDATMLWKDQAGCRPATWSHAFSAFSPECACVAAKIVCNFYLSSLTHSAQCTCAHVNAALQWTMVTHLSRGERPPRRKWLAWKCWLPAHSCTANILLQPTLQLANHSLLANRHKMSTDCKSLPKRGSLEKLQIINIQGKNAPSIMVIWCPQYMVNTIV